MTSNPLRLLFVTKHLSGRGGGAERVLTLIASELADRGHEVMIATFDPGGVKDFYPVDPRVRRERLGVGDALAKSGPSDFLGHVKALRRLLRHRKVDVAVGFMHSSFVPLGLAAIGTGVPVIASEHTAFDHYRAFGVQGALVRATSPLFAAFTATSDRIRRGFPSAIARRMTVIPNPVLFPRAVFRDFASSTKVLLCVGVLREEKGHRTLIAAFAKLAERFPDWTLRIVGDGPLRHELEQQVREAGLAKRVTLTGALTDVSPEYAAAELFVVPSSYESFGLATAEALAAGIPAVGFADCPGTNEIIKHQLNGVLVSGTDPADALSRGLAELMGDEEKRTHLGQEGPASVAGYSVDAVADRWEELISRIHGAERRA